MPPGRRGPAAFELLCLVTPPPHLCPRPAARVGPGGERGRRCQVDPEQRFLAAPELERRRVVDDRVDRRTGAGAQLLDAVAAAQHEVPGRVELHPVHAIAGVGLTRHGRHAHEDPSAGGEQRERTPQLGGRVGDVLEAVVEHHQIELAGDIGERTALEPTAGVEAAITVDERVDTEHRLDAGEPERVDDDTGTTTDVEHPAGLAAGQTSTANGPQH